MNSVALIGSLRTSGSPPIPHTTKRYRVMVAVPRRKSDGRFGLSVQTRILKATGNDPKKFHSERYAQFEKAVGWPYNSEQYDRADPKNVPQGYFPYNLGFSYETYGSGFNRTWRLNLNPDCGF